MSKLFFDSYIFDKIGHTLGINIYHKKQCKLLKDKLLPNEFYRNYYCYGRVSDNKDIPQWILQIDKYIDKWNQSGCLYFQINDKGVELFKDQYQIEIIDTHVELSRSKQRYQEFLNADLGITFSEYLGISKVKYKRKYI